MARDRSAPTSIVHTDEQGVNFAKVGTVPPVSGTDTALMVYANLGSATIPVQDAADGATGGTAPATAIEVGGVDGNNKLQALQVDANKLLKTSNVGVGLQSYGQPSIGSTATVIKAANASRAAIVVKNPKTNANPVFIGDASVTATTGHQLDPGDAITLPVVSAVYGIVASGSQTVTYLEIQ